MTPSSGTIAGDVLRPDVVMAVIDGVLQTFDPGSLTRERERLRDDLDTVERQVSLLAQAIAAGGPLGALLAALRAAENRRGELKAALAAQAGLEQRVDRRALEHTICRQLDDWRGLLTKQVPCGRQLLPLRLTPVERTYRLERGKKNLVVAVHGSVEGCNVHFEGIAA